MKNTLKRLFRTPNFVIGFVILVSILLIVMIYPLFNPGDPLAMIGYNSFIPPGTYVSVYDALDIEARKVYRLELEGADDARIYAKLLPEDREAIKDWLLLYSKQYEYVNISEADIDIEDRYALIALWEEHYSPDIFIQGLTNARINFYVRLGTKLNGLFNLENKLVYTTNPETGEDIFHMTVRTFDYVNVNDIVNTRVLPLGTDNFGRDMLKQLVSATGTSLMIGLIAGIIATFIGLLLGLLAGYIGGIVDDIIMFITNLFTVIPGIVLLILISYSIGQEQRGPATVAIVIGFTSWVWTTRSVRAQVISLRNRDHVNLSKLSGHSLPRILLMDILPYIASYVIMAFILQISTGILAEAGLSMLGLGPKTTESATLGLMMNWAMRYTAHLQNAWWAYYPVIFVIAAITFSLNLMNTGLDKVFNPQLRD
jgi:peptide/nickel transport system permease protein